MITGKARRNSAGWLIVGAAIAAILLVLLAGHAPGNANEYLESLQTFRWAAIAGVILSTTLHFLLTAWKWRFITRLTAREADLGWGYYYYTALIALLGQVLPMQVAVLAGRSIALRVHQQVPIGRGAAGAIYDQLFDVAIPGILLLPALLHVFGWLDLADAMLLSAALLALVGLLVAFAGEQAILLLLRVLPLLGMRNVADGSKEIATALLLRNCIGKLYLVSTLRFSNLVLRAWLIAWSMNLDVSPGAMLFCTSAVTFSLLLNFVPGALGVVEWGWIGTLTLFGLPSDSAFVYALTSRTVMVATLIVLNLVHLAVLGLVRITEKFDSQ
jgi:hypothetical protein